VKRTHSTRMPPLCRGFDLKAFAASRNVEGQ
jgi:hypothetical protein